MRQLVSSILLLLLATVFLFPHHSASEKKHFVASSLQWNLGHDLILDLISEDDVLPENEDQPSSHSTFESISLDTNCPILSALKSAQIACSLPKKVAAIAILINAP
jgi:hypothetical protein